MNAQSKGRSGTTIPSSYFAELYRQKADPWNYAESAYEADKYETSLAALPRERYARALELGCSVGVFTRLLASRCGELTAVDVSNDAIATARERCAEAKNVHFAGCDLTTGFPQGVFDLITFCELGFYFGPYDLARIRDDIANALTSGGTLLLVHWTPLVMGHAQTADDVHDAFIADSRFAHHASAAADTYRLDVLTRMPHGRA